jgi:hypothetical protein
VSNLFNPYELNLADLLKVFQVYDYKTDGKNFIEIIIRILKLLKIKIYRK